MRLSVEVHIDEWPETDEATQPIVDAVKAELENKLETDEVDLPDGVSINLIW
jgi:hypothetical protein